MVIVGGYGTVSLGFNSLQTSLFDHNFSCYFIENFAIFLNGKNIEKSPESEFFERKTIGLKFLDNNDDAKVLL